jgi:hypothetical protein
MQAFTGSPSIKTVHAPHSPRTHPPDFRLKNPKRLNTSSKLSAGWHSALKVLLLIRR